MNQKEKADRIQAILNDLFPAPPIPLDHHDPFTLLVSVVLSAQTTDKKVNQVTPALFQAAPDAAALAKLSIEQIHGYIREVGLAPQKAKSLSGLAKLLVERHGGQVPADFEALIELPGVGRKTANVVMAQAFGVPSFPVDTHILRLAGRWGLSNGKTADDVEEDLKRIFPRETWNKLHLQIIYFGREHCPALHHDLSSCPICSFAASKSRIADEAATKSAKKSQAKSGKKPTAKKVAR